MKPTTNATNGTNETVKEVLNAINEISANLDSINTVLTFDEIKAITNPLERIEALKRFQKQQTELSLIKTSKEVHNAFLKGADFLALSIYKNSVMFEMTATKTLYIDAQKLKDSNNKVIGMTPNAFTRTFNTSLYTLSKNAILNAENRKQGIDAKTENETIDYFENINQRIIGLKGKTIESLRFQKLFAPYLINGIVPQTLTVLINSIEVENTKMFPFGHYNEILVYNANENDHSVEIFKLWLQLKGAEDADFLNENEL